eukprot:m.74255 g.74255  ORF g.74255 m.74255 type:complete len:67 (+) comp50337_c0_seq9:1118-1318(+)
MIQHFFTYFPASNVKYCPPKRVSDGGIGTSIMQMSKALNASSLDGAQQGRVSVFILGIERQSKLGD